MTPAVGLAGGVVGFKVEFESEYGKKWSVSRDWDDMALPETHFVPCSSITELRQILAQRLGVPVEGETDHLTYVYYDSYNLYELRVPLLRFVQNGWYEAVTAGIRKYGTVLVSSGLAKDLRADRVFQASNLVVSGRPVSLGIGGQYDYHWNYYYQLRVDPKAAKGRRTRAATLQERVEKRMAETRLREAREAIEREKNAKQDAIDSKHHETLRKAMNLACRRIIKRLPPVPVLHAFTRVAETNLGFSQFVELLRVCEVLSPHAFKLVPGRSRFRPFDNPKINRAIALAVKHKRLWADYYRASDLARIIREHFGVLDFKLPRKKTGK